MKQIIEQAEKLGFKKLKAPLMEKNRYIDLCLIQKFLRDEKGLDIEVTCNYERYDMEVIKKNYLISSKYNIDTYEQALKQGILHALKELENE